jgi:CRP/FNR family transcriptional regulator, dissimilatory nitrate respiration regulator
MAIEKLKTVTYVTIKDIFILNLQKKRFMVQNLEECLLFNGLNSNEIEQQFLNIPFQLKKYKKEELIAIAETEVKCLFILSQGSVRGEMTDDSGRTIKIEDIEAPNLLAPAFLFGNQNKFPVNIIANKESSIISVQKVDFIKLLQSNGLILTNFLNNISNRAQFLSGKLKFLSFQTIKGKLAHFFIQISKKAGTDVFISPKSQNELAEMFGVARPSLSRAIREMDKEGLIKAEGKNIKILNKKGLMNSLK